MKNTALTAALLLLTMTQVSEVFCQSELIINDDDFPFKPQFMPIVKTNRSVIKEYSKNPKNKPKPDFTPKGIKPEPQSAGVSWLKMSSRITGGAAAAQKQFPWQTVVIVDRSSLCGGSLIATNWVLTAAHCIIGGSSFIVMVGGIDRTIAETGEKRLTSIIAIYHENYTVSTLSNDIAVVKLPEDLILDEFINVVRVPRQRQAFATFANKTVTASGYGWTANSGHASTILNFVSLVVTSNANCASFYGTEIITSSILCTAADALKSTCRGDSGSPLVLKEADGKFMQIGIVSFGAAASCTRHPAGYSRVASFLGWISQKTGISIRR